ncbi:MAG: methyl-accepting chemotaxis protein [Bacillota bacterium]
MGIVEKLNNQIYKLQKLNIFSKWKIFYQIQIIVAVLIISLVVLGFVSLRTIENMKQTANELMDSNSVLYNVAALRGELIKINYEYLQALVENRQALLKSSSAESVKLLLNNIKSFDQNNVEECLKRMDNLIKIANLPTDKENYELLKDQIIELNSFFTIIQGETTNTSIEFNTKNAEYYATATTFMIIILVLSGIISTILGLLISISISGALKKIDTVSKDLATGNLVSSIEVTGSPEIRKVAASLNQAMVGLRQLVLGINQETEKIANASKDLERASKDTGQSAQEVSRAMNALAIASSEQTKQISQAVDTVSRLVEMVDQVNVNTQTIAVESTKMADSAKSGQQATNLVTSEIQKIYDFNKEIELVINELNQKTEEIIEIITLIQNIADQTTLLALNASIEAARAGEHGRGFGVVAAETGKLAEQSKVAANLINDLITKIKGHSERAVEVSKEGIARMESGKELIFEANNTFVNIYEKLMVNLKQINTVAELVSKMSERNNVTIAAITSIAAITEENMANTEEVSATSQEQTALTEEVSSLAIELSQVVENLKRSIGAFRLE